MLDLYNELARATKPDGEYAQRCVVELQVNAPSVTTGLPFTKVLVVFPPMTLTAPTNKYELSRLLQDYVTNLPKGDVLVSVHYRHSDVFQSLFRK